MSETLSSTSISPRLERIARLAKRTPQVALTTLAHHIDVDWLHHAYGRTRKSGAVGVDGQTAQSYAANLEANLQALLDRAKSGTYRAPPVRRVFIPKGDGKKLRPIGIPTFEDKILQRAVGFQEASVIPIRDQSHLVNTLPYTIDQPRRHGVADPYHEGTSLPDALGMRVLAPYLPERLARAAPRLRLEKLAGPVGPSLDDDDPRALAKAAAAAIGQPNLIGKGQLVRDARRVVVELATGASVKELIAAMGGSERALRRLRHRPRPDQRLFDAIRAQVRWRAASKPG